VLCDVSTNSGGITIDGRAGLIVVTIGPDQTAGPTSYQPAPHRV
jgi:hypothetical protein